VTSGCARGSVAFRGAGGIIVAVAAGVVAFAMTLAQQIRKFVSESPGPFASAALGQKVLRRITRGFDYQASAHEIGECSAHDLLGLGQKPCHGWNRSARAEPLAFEPEQEFEHLIPARDFSASFVRHTEVTP